MINPFKYFPDPSLTNKIVDCDLPYLTKWIADELKMSNYLSWCQSEIPGNQCTCIFYRKNNLNTNKSFIKICSAPMTWTESLWQYLSYDIEETCNHERILPAANQKVVFLYERYCLTYLMCFPCSNDCLLKILSSSTGEGKVAQIR